LRASELLSLNVDNFDSSGGLSANGKSGKRSCLTVALMPIFRHSWRNREFQGVFSEEMKI
jgi:hypothetical protein